MHTEYLSNVTFKYYIFHKLNKINIQLGKTPYRQMDHLK